VTLTGDYNLGEIRQKYQNKRAGKRYKKDRQRRLKKWKEGKTFFVAPNNYVHNIVNLKAPKDFSLIENTNEVLDYLKVGNENLKNHNSICFDISKIESFTPDVIPLLISHIREVGLKTKVPIHGNAPENVRLRQIFTESGFYDHVRCKQKFKVSDNNIMHKEANFKVKPEIAARSVELIVKNCNCGDEYVEPIYNIFIELMSNTHHHANLSQYGSSRWWLYVFADENTKKVSLSFLDLGVGIFKSMVVRTYLKRIGRSIKLLNNTSLVSDLLSGKVQSRIDIDNEMRGKGIPQIVEYSKLDCFDKFFLITNDVKIDLKTNHAEKLSSNLMGTFYYIEFKNYNNV